MKTVRGIGVDVARRIYDDDRNILFEDIRKSRSFVNNFMGMVGRSLGGASLGVGTYLNTGGGGCTPALTGYYYDITYLAWAFAAGMNLMGGAGSTLGIQVGNSNTPFSVNQYVMGGLISHGSGSGQLSYGGMVSVNDPSWIDPGIFLILSRDFSNAGIAAVTVKEIGLLGNPCCTGTYGSSQANILYARDVVSDTVIDAGKILNVQYIFKTVV